jgi:hypothetical protein
MLDLPVPAESDNLHGGASAWNAATAIDHQVRSTGGG